MSGGLSRRQLVKGGMLGAAVAPAMGCVVGNAESTTMETTQTDDLYRSAAQSARLIRDGELSSRALVAGYQDRISAVNPLLNAVVALADDALVQAEQADAELAAGQLRGPLHGVPMTIKDCFDTAGVVSTWGTAGRKNFVPAEDATVVARLKKAGAILVGKTNTPEFTLSFETHNDLFGFTHNPYELSHSPGGSSGGAAALLAVGGIGFDIGTDYGGSVRVPSHCCGTVGIKPTSGSVPRTGLCLPPGLLGDDLSHIGPMARKVEDLALLLPIIWGPDGRDSRIAPVPLLDADTVDLGELRCAVMVDNGVASPDSETAAVVQNVAQVLVESGMTMSDDRIPTAAQSDAVQGALWGVGVHASVQELLAAAGTPKDAWSIRWFRELADNIDKNISTAQLNAVLAEFEAVRRQSLEFMAGYDVLLSPVNARPAQPHPKPGGAPFPATFATYTSLFDVTGFPAGVVRGGTTRSGLPIGVQIVANPWREDIVLAVMAFVERNLGEFPRPPAFA